jgi:hypothetical protein
VVSCDKMSFSRVINRGLAVRQGVVVTRKLEDGGAKDVDGIANGGNGSTLRGVTLHGVRLEVGLRISGC